jgi:elongation factor P--(R)-beta-lysine ligase
MDLAVLQLRSRVLQAIRRFFVERGFVEVETPVRLPTPTLELHIDAEPSGSHFLRTSPEMRLKRLLAAGAERIFELGPCFRQGERGHLHNPEFTLLEWYRRGADYLDILVDTKGLLAYVVREVLGRAWIEYRGVRIEIAPAWECLTVREAFLSNAGWDPLTAFDADRFDLDLVTKVEPAFPLEHPLVLKDYPVAQAALAQCQLGPPPYGERWELYVGGLELANAFSELTDAAAQRQRFEECAAERRQLGKTVYPVDEEFLAALESGLPPCGGIALGVDRLVMLLAGKAAIEDVRLV